jgi:very-short-patch-repair endonuclease
MKQCSICGIEIKNDKRYKYCSECSIKVKRQRNNELSLKHYYKNKTDRIIHCEACNSTIVNPTSTQRFCQDCAKLRRKLKMKKYKETQKEKHGNKYSNKENKRKMREERASNDLCIDCGGPKERTITRCFSCNETFKERNIKYNRSRGMSPAGCSQYQNLAFEMVKDITSFEVRKNDRSTIFNPITNYGLELDIYIKELSLAFEIDGPMHREPIYGEERLSLQEKNDKIKDEQCLKQGIKLIRISTDDIIKNQDEWLRTILSEAIRMANK